MTDANQRADANLPAADRQAAVERIDELARGARGVEERLASITGRWPQVPMLHHCHLGRSTSRRWPS